MQLQALSAAVVSVLPLSTKAFAGMPCHMVMENAPISASGLPVGTEVRLASGTPGFKVTGSVLLPGPH